MSKIQLLRVLVNERLSAAADEIFDAVEKTIAGYEEEIFRSKQEIRRQRRLLNAVYKPDIKLSKLSDQPQLSLSVWEEEFPEEQQHCEQEWSPGLGQGDQGDPGYSQIHKNNEELYSSRGGEQLQGLDEDGTIKFIFTPPYVKNEHDQSQPSYPGHDGMGESEGDPVPSTSTQQIHGKCDGAGLSSDCSAAENGDSDDDWKEIGLYQTDDSDSNEDKWKKSEGSETRKSKKTPMAKKEKSRIGCKVCGKSFHAIVSLVNHMEIHTKDVCGVCGEHCETEESFQLHLKTHVKAEVCNICGKCFGGSRSLEMHMRVHTGEKPFICSECGKSFNCHHNLRRHIRIHTGEKPYSCGACGKCFSDHSTLKRHLVTHLQGIRSPPLGVLSDDCPVPENMDDSDAVKSETPALKRHQTRTICEVCGKMFHSMVSLVNHAKIHATDLCGVCGTRFESEEALKVHLKTHKNGKVCDICGKCFDSHGSLEMHMRVHTGEKPFLCSECGKSFNCRHNMMRHMRTHTGEKPYLCNECGRCFSDHSTLKQHVSTHTGEKPHRCDVCGKGFHRKTYVRLHMKSHTSEK